MSAAINTSGLEASIYENNPLQIKIFAISLQYGLIEDWEIKKAWHLNVLHFDSLCAGFDDQPLRLFSSWSSERDSRQRDTWKDSFIFLMYVIVWSSIFTIEYEWGQIPTCYWNHGTWMPDSKSAPGR